jgi:hypothetical protein
VTGQGTRGPEPAASRDLSLALLATRVSELSGQLGQLTARLDTNEAAVAGHARTIAEAAGLAREVTRLSEAVTAMSPEPADFPAGGHPRMPPWAAMDDPTYVDSLRDLARWVADILLARYPHARVVLPPCWPAHPAAVEELDWLYWDWTGWAGSPVARSRDAGDWHDRWLPGVLARLRPCLQDCASNGEHAKPDYPRAVPGDLLADDAAPEQLFIEAMGRTRALEDASPG